MGEPAVGKLIVKKSAIGNPVVGIPAVGKPEIPTFENRFEILFLKMARNFTLNFSDGISAVRGRSGSGMWNRLARRL